MHTLRIFQPHHQPTGETFAVIITTGAGIIEVPCWTAQEAGQVRDAALDAGYRARILGLPLHLTAAGFPKLAGPLPAIED